MNRRAHGFTLLELMVATAVFALLLAGTVSASVFLNRRGQMEELSNNTLQQGTVVADLMTPAIMEASAGVGAAVITFGNADWRYGINVTPSTVTPTGAFGSTAAAKQLYGSDDLRVYWGQVEGSVPLKECFAAGPLAILGTNLYCVGQVQPAFTPDFLKGVPVFFTNPDRLFACAHTAVLYTPGTPSSMLVSPGISSLPVGDPCLGTTLDTFFSLSTTSHPSVARAHSLGFRVVWGDGNYPATVPVLQMEKDRDFATLAVTDSQDWTTIAKNVESIRFSLGVSFINSSVATPPLTWFPEFDAAGAKTRPYISECVLGLPGCVVPDAQSDGGNGLTTNDTALPFTASPTPADETLRFQLMRRVRAVRIQVTVRSDREDRDAPDSGMGFKFKRRTMTYQVALPNFVNQGGTP